MFFRFPTNTIMVNHNFGHAFSSNQCKNRKYGQLLIPSIHRRTLRGCSWCQRGYRVLSGEPGCYAEGRKFIKSVGCVPSCSLVQDRGLQISDVCPGNTLQPPLLAPFRKGADLFPHGVGVGRDSMFIFQKERQCPLPESASNGGLSGTSSRKLGDC